jgi:hypothetical protein
VSTNKDTNADPEQVSGSALVTSNVGIIAPLPQVLHLLDQGLEHFLGVPEEHARLGVVEQLVLDAGEAGPMPRFMTMIPRAKSAFRIGIPWIGLPGSFRAAGLTTSLAPITRATSVRSNSR